MQWGKDKVLMFAGGVKCVVDTYSQDMNSPHVYFYILHILIDLRSESIMVFWLPFLKHAL